jgi:hypothetical protein
MAASAEGPSTSEYVGAELTKSDRPELASAKVNTYLNRNFARQKTVFAPGLWIRNDLFRIDCGFDFKEVSAPTSDPTPDPDLVSDPATLVSASRKLRGNYTDFLVT